MRMQDDGSISGRDGDFRYFRQPTPGDLRRLAPRPPIVKITPTRDELLAKRADQRRRVSTVQEKIAVVVKRRAVVSSATAPPQKSLTHGLASRIKRETERKDHV